MMLMIGLGLLLWGSAAILAAVVLCGAMLRAKRRRALDRMFAAFEAAAAAEAAEAYVNYQIALLEKQFTGGQS
jgi:hypothetical protein